MSASTDRELAERRHPPMSLDPAHDQVLAEAGSKDPIRIAIVGAGRIGRALAVRFAAHGHMVRLSNPRGPDTLAEAL
jgi:phosphoglycerate dehydrogenase-like enzyme